MRGLLSTILLMTALAFARAANADTVVPNVKGLTAAAAIAAVQAAGFEYNILSESSCSSPGIVSDTRPPEGSIVLAVPPRVNLIVSQGGVGPLEGVTVPNVLNNRLEQAQKSLAAIGLTAIDTIRGTEPKGKCPTPVGPPRLIDSVMETKPSAGTLVCSGSNVVVYRLMYQRYQEPKGPCP
ncbi:PASTA domain-containing protein [Rhizobium leguminosarum]|uniref:PASTA domain-containing protein n=1 Tax=Rhizobium leguminosarum TaxID=384 RepID=UPI001C95356F|nr:PASTA domain-containing protein [Rhizobium leguminosarum]MBY5456870.1 PASTA domain-containing protein [Rhizobium leguminosarum]